MEILNKEKLTLRKIQDILESSPVQISTHVSDKEKINTEQRNIGDTWVDSDGNNWEQKDGYRVKTSANHESFQKVRDELYTPKNCPKCNKMIITWQDKKFYRSHNMCMRCVILYEHDLKLSGKYEEYEKERIKANSLAWLKDAEAEVQMLKEALKYEYVNEDGTIEKWASDIPVEVMKQQIQDEFDKFKEDFLKKLE